MRSNKQVVVIAATSTLAGIMFGLWLGGGGTNTRRPHRRRRHPVGSKADEIEHHIQTTQRPASLLGITVDDYSPAGDGDEESSSSSLTLSAPLSLNHNVHKTAFAGSLYSVAVLCSYYLGRAWLLEQQQQQQQQSIMNDENEEEQQQQQPEKYTLVARQGSIQYRRPVTCDRIVAKSVLPSRTVLTHFKNTLLQVGKATMHIQGQVLIPPEIDDGNDADDDEKKQDNQQPIVACEYSIEVCAFVPRNSRNSRNNSSNNA